jgi:hypothetical protein
MYPMASPIICIGISWPSKSRNGKEVIAIVLELTRIGQAYPWVVPLGTSHLDFLGPIKLWKIIGNT